MFVMLPATTGVMGIALTSALLLGALGGAGWFSGGMLMEYLAGTLPASKKQKVETELAKREMDLKEQMQKALVESARMTTETEQSRSKDMLGRMFDMRQEERRDTRTGQMLGIQAQRESMNDQMMMKVLEQMMKTKGERTGHVREPMPASMISLLRS